MNTRNGRSEIFSSRPDQHASRSHYETAFTTLQNNQTLAYIFIAFISVPIFLGYLGFVPVSLFYLPWDLLVFLTPSRIVIALDPRISTSDPNSLASSPLSFQVKSDAMKRILGLDNSINFPFFSQSRSLSIFGNALLGNTKDAAPPGLGNWNNSCFQNSIIQGLASLKYLTEFLGHNVDNLSGKASISTHKALLDLIDRLNSASESGTKLWISGPLKSMSSWQQQDAQEYFSKLLDQIDHEAELCSRGETFNMGLKIAGPDENIFRDSDCEDPASPQEPESLPSTDKLYLDRDSSCNPLEGLLAQRVGCMECGWTEGLSLIPFNCLTVPLGRRSSYDVRECLDQYMTLEPIEGVECAKCTLLHRQEQLLNLINGFEADESPSDSSDEPRPFDAVKLSAYSRLEAVKTALECNDFSETTLANKCHINKNSRVSTTKSRQAVIARAPRCLAIHINRSVFDEMTGMLEKNLAAVAFPQTIDLNNWCLGTRSLSKSGDNTERWETNPSRSMLPQPGESIQVPSRHYQLRAIITHYGRHENGHYICYRKYPTSEFTAPAPDEILQAEGDKDKPERWWRLSDDDVQMVSEGHVMTQGGAFMLFYEAVDDSVSPCSTPCATREHDLHEGYADSTQFGAVEPKNISTPSSVTDFESATSRETSISLPMDDLLPVDPSLKTSSMVDTDAERNGELDTTSTSIA
ncbi:Peptidase C19 ubiquitin carboxyl-terminal hydrolase 2 [Penicillium coprophilum]|uniref:Peptidase C19 ubiquitin carboxyl-terminal hydrolase 2 n=1 Tax=Penicillium coprophilum TaxID=36646 RepID=UPI00238290FA|nr:Peptidase C19 ubiquitin carboxyl-terminal hydrolase 2 [Penicillium coprophilum]KAJ5178202.1 Peptidase C19 ubiquitin carboxyl-terminal hydrolase 2 [Penicillium coprophilum]